MLKFYVKTTEAVKRLSTDKDGVVSLEYVVVGAVIVAVVIGVFQGTGTNSLTGALSSGFGAIVTAMAAL